MIFCKFEEIDWEGFPEHMRAGLWNYVNYGIPTGSFLEALLTNDLRRAVKSADRVNIAVLYGMVDFCNMNIPASCWGSKEAYDQWIKLGGLIKILGERGNDNDLDGPRSTGMGVGEDAEQG